MREGRAGGAARLAARGVDVRRGGRLVVDGVTFTAASGSTIGIIGPNGAGKTSLMLALYRALPHEGGEVLVDGRLLESMRRRDIARCIGVVAQETEAALPLSVADSVNLGRIAHRSFAGYGDDDDRGRVAAALAQVGLTHLAGRLMTELSGGELQRALIARAIVQDTPYLLLDEPTNHLDLHHQFALFDLVRSLPTTTVVILHDLNLAAQVCDELVLLHEGRVVASGPTADVLDPDLIAATYHVTCRAVTHDGRRQLLFSPEPHAPTRPDPPPAPLEGTHP